jgi:DnaJ-domain-containing protein 1
MTNDPTKSTNPFEILGFTPSFSITPDQVQRAYLQRLTASHPDLSGQSAQTLDPATLNHARDTLLDDEARANLMLEHLGGPSPKDHTLPDGFLMEMMQLRTQIEEELDPSNPDHAQARTQWQAWANAERAQTIQTLTQIFKQLESPNPDTSTEASTDSPEELKQSIRTQLNAHRYTQRLIEQLDPTYDPSNADF